MTTTKHVFIDYRGNWADEMSFRGFRISTREDWESHIKEIPKTFEMYYGSNQSQEMTKEEYIACYTVRDISEEDVAYLVRILQLHLYKDGCSFGQFKMLEYWDDEHEDDGDGDGE